MDDTNNSDSDNIRCGEEDKARNFTSPSPKGGVFTAAAPTQQAPLPPQPSSRGSSATRPRRPTRSTRSPLPRTGPSPAPPLLANPRPATSPSPLRATPPPTPAASPSPTPTPPPPRAPRRRFLPPRPPPPLRTVFGCIFSSYDSSAAAAATHGLLGMNRGALSFVTQSATRRFSYCISDRDDSGVLLLGGDAGSALFAPRLNYTPLIEISLPLPYFDRVAYSVQLEGIRVGAALLPIPKSVLAPDHTGAGQTMVDSGTQFTFLLGDAYDALKVEFLRQTRALLTPLNEPDFVFQGAFDLCFRIPAAAAGAGAGAPLPSLLPEVGVRRGGDGVWCATFGNSDLVPMSAYVIGHHHQQNLWVEYDLDNRRVGFAPVRCDLAAQRLTEALSL
uniref:Peptidase A1 domain-containing protein n=1 Tax=Ananas comosus var. bracteatus TaxID=296719 RepID=A0A6V7QU29_ANACO